MAAAEVAAALVVVEVAVTETVDTAAGVAVIAMTDAAAVIGMAAAIILGVATAVTMVIGAVMVVVILVLVFISARPITQRLITMRRTSRLIITRQRSSLCPRRHLSISNNPNNNFLRAIGITAITRKAITPTSNNAEAVGNKLRQILCKTVKELKLRSNALSPVCRVEHRSICREQPEGVRHGCRTAADGQEAHSAVPRQMRGAQDISGNRVAFSLATCFWRRKRK